MSKNYGSLTNLLLGNGTTETKPEVGMGATVVMWSDRHPYTIVEVSKSGKTIKIQRDDAKRIDKNGMSESQEYEYTPNTDAPIEVARLRNGRWKLQGSKTSVIIGVREEYYDFTF